MIKSDGQGIVLMSKDRASSRGSLGGKVDVQNLDANPNLRMLRANEHRTSSKKLKSWVYKRLH